MGNRANYLRFIIAGISVRSSEIFTILKIENATGYYQLTLKFY